LELFSHGGETEHEMEIISYSVDENLPQLLVVGVVRFSFQFLELGLDVQEPDIPIVLGNQVGDFTSGQDHIDELEEVLESDLGISQKESRWLVKMTRPVVELSDEVS